MDEWDDIAELKRQVADLSELTNAMRHRASLTRGTPEWDQARQEEERLVKQIEAWSQRHVRRPDGEADGGPSS